MQYNFKEFKERSKSIEEWLRKEFQSIRTGQATPAILDHVMVDSYGSKVPLHQVGNIGIEDSKTLKVTPWDSTMLKEIEKAITISNLGLGTRLDDTGVYVSFPSLTAERRESFVKLAKEKCEEGRISLRKERERVLHDFDTKEERGGMTEDEVKRAKTELQKLMDESNKKFDELKEKKEREILS